MFYKVFYKDLLFYAVYGLLKWKMIRGNGFTAISCFIFVSQKFGGTIYTNFLSSVPWMNYFSNRRLPKVTPHSVCEIRKIMELPALLLVKPCLPHVDTLKQTSNE